MKIILDLGWIKPSTLEEILEDARTMRDGAESDKEMYQGAALVVKLKRAIRES